MTDLQIISESLSDAEKWGQLAEEASELSQAALKMQRIYTPINKPRKTYEECIDNLREEIADILVCLDVIGSCIDWGKVDRISREKKSRWARGIKGAASMEEPKQVGICACDYCGDAIAEGEEYYAMPSGECLHEDCLFDWARGFRKIEWSDD